MGPMRKSVQVTRVKREDNIPTEGRQAQKAETKMSLRRAVVEAIFRPG